MRIGILQTDSVLEEFQPRFGDYPKMFQRVLDEPGTRPLAFDVVDCLAQRYPQPDSCDGYVITGSRYSVYDDEPWIGELAGFVKAALGAGRRVVGICFGHQLIAHFFGGRAALAEAGWCVGVHKTRMLVRKPWMQPWQPEISLLSSHKDQVSRLPDGATLIASSDSCPNAGYVIADRVFTLQGHPEFTKPYARELMTIRQELLGQGTFEKGIGSLAEDTHEGVAARWMLNFMAQ